MTITIDHLISHRFRGFAPRENSLEGLRAALAFGVKYLEFDIRVAACGTPMIYHDEYAIGGDGKKHLLKDVKASDFKSVGGDFPYFPSFEALLQTVANSPHRQAQLLIDIKDAGFETEITSLVRLYRMHNRVTYVSWLPEALYACHELEPEAPLCLSHWCKKPGPLIRAKHQVYNAISGHVPRSGKTYMHGERSGWYLSEPVKGDMLDMLKRTKGSVCVPVGMVTKDLVEAYHTHGLQVSVFSYVDMKKALAHQAEMGMDLYFVDKKRVFDAL